MAELTLGHNEQCKNLKLEAEGIRARVIKEYETKLKTEQTKASVHERTVIQDDIEMIRLQRDVKDKGIRVAQLTKQFEHAEVKQQTTPTHAHMRLRASFNLKPRDDEKK